MVMRLYEYDDNHWTVFCVITASVVEMERRNSTKREWKYLFYFFIYH
jgi:hypothetical protein